MSTTSPDKKAVTSAMKKQTDSLGTFSHIDDVQFIPETAKATSNALKSFLGSRDGHPVHCLLESLDGSTNLQLIHEKDGRQKEMTLLEIVTHCELEKPFKYIAKSYSNPETAREILSPFLKACFIVKGCVSVSKIGLSEGGLSSVKRAIGFIEKAKLNEERKEYSRAASVIRNQREMDDTEDQAQQRDGYTAYGASVIRQERSDGTSEVQLSSRAIDNETRAHGKKDPSEVPSAESIAPTMRSEEMDSSDVPLQDYESDYEKSNLREGLLDGYKKEDRQVQQYRREIATERLDLNNKDRRFQDLDGKMSELQATRKILDKERENQKRKNIMRTFRSGVSCLRPVISQPNQKRKVECLEEKCKESGQKKKEMLNHMTGLEGLVLGQRLQRMGRE